LRDGGETFPPSWRNKVGLVVRLMEYGRKLFSKEAYALSHSLPESPMSSGIRYRKCDFRYVFTSRNCHWPHRDLSAGGAAHYQPGVLGLTGTFLVGYKLSTFNEDGVDRVDSIFAGFPVQKAEMVAVW